MLTIDFTIPSNLFLTQKQIVSLSTDAVNVAVASTEKDFASTIATFSSRSKFKFRVQRAQFRSGVVSGSVSTDNENYCRINFGTKARIIRSRKRPMSFRPGYHPRTTRRKIGSGASRRSGPQLVRWAVGTRKKHKIEAREFDEAIAAKNAPKFYADTDRRLDAALKSS